MGQICTVCSHDAHHEINIALVSTRASYRDIAGQYGVSKSAVMRHSREHIPQLLVKASQAIEVANADDLLQKVEDLYREALAVLEAGKGAQDHKLVLLAIDRAGKQLERLAELRGELDRRPTVNVLIAPQVRTAIIAALEPYDAARWAVAGALEQFVKPEK